MLIIIGGSTATGKTDFAAALAKKLGTGIISADSMQIYKGMDIGTAKAKDEEIGIKQYCVDIISPTEPFSVVDYREAAEKAIGLEEKKSGFALIAGGTGFYVNSLLYPLNYGAVRDFELENKLTAELKEHGAERLHKKLTELDPEAAGKIHPNNTRRLIRALSVVISSGNPFYSQNTAGERVRPYKMFVLSAQSRAELYSRIDSRVDKMLSSGLESEVMSLIDAGVRFDMQSMQGIGYKEWAGYFGGDLSVPEVAELIKKNTRAYAKRQETWFNNQYKDKSIVIISSPSDIDKYTDQVAELLYKPY